MSEVYTTNTYSVKTQKVNADKVLINPNDGINERVDLLTLFNNNSEEDKDYSFRVRPSYSENGEVSHFTISSGNVFLENKQIIQIPAKDNLQVSSSETTPQYIALDVYNNPDGTITYSYSVADESKLSSLGYSIIIPTEDTININD